MGGGTALLIWFGLALLTALIASHNGFSPGWYFLFALLAGIVAALATLNVAKDVHERGS